MDQPTSGQPPEKRAKLGLRKPLGIAKDFKVVWRDTARFLNRHRWRYVSSLALLAGVCLILINPMDQELLWIIQGSERSELAILVAGKVATWGDFLILNVGGVLAIWSIGYVARSRWIQRVAVAAFLGAVLAGLACNALRLTTARPRPYVEAEDRFHGVAGAIRGYGYHSFPSGHTSTAFGSGVPVAVAGGIWAAPAVLVSASVGWSRLHRNRHYPTDVLVGAYFGSAFGLAASWRLAQIRRRLKRMKRSKQRTAFVSAARVAREDHKNLLPSAAGDV